MAQPWTTDIPSTVALTTVCDHCGQFPVFGRRYHCHICVDCDFCSACAVALPPTHCCASHSLALSEDSTPCMMPCLQSAAVQAVTLACAQPGWDRPVVEAASLCREEDNRNADSPKQPNGLDPNDLFTYASSRASDDASRVPLGVAAAEAATLLATAAPPSLVAHASDASLREILQGLRGWELPAIDSSAVFRTEMELLAGLQQHPDLDPSDPAEFGQFDDAEAECTDADLNMLEARECLAKTLPPWWDGVVGVAAACFVAVAPGLTEDQWATLPHCFSTGVHGPLGKRLTAAVDLVVLRWVCELLGSNHLDHPPLPPAAPPSDQGSPTTEDQVTLVVTEVHPKAAGPERASSDPLPVYLVPYRELAKSSRMPVWQACRVAEQTSALPVGSVVLFFSHAWAQPDDPDPKGADWHLLQSLVHEVVWAAVDAYCLLCHGGVSRPVLWAMAHALQTREGGQRVQHTYPLHPSPAVVDRLDEESLRTSATESLFGRLFTTLLHETAAAPQASASDCREDLAAACLDKVFVWIDFVCLPQEATAVGVTEARPPALSVIMERSLENLSALQASMITVVANKSEGYLERAWCFAELHLSVHSLLAHEHVAINHNVGGTPVHQLKRDNLLRSAVSLFDPTVSGRNVETALAVLGLGITDADSNALHVCRVLWDAVRNAVLIGRGSTASLWTRVAEIATVGVQCHAEATGLFDPESGEEWPAVVTLAQGTGAVVLQRLRALAHWRTLPVEALMDGGTDGDPGPTSKGNPDMRVFLYMGNADSNVRASAALADRDPFSVLLHVVATLLEVDECKHLEVGLSSDLSIALHPNTVLVGYGCHPELRGVAAIVF